jgi:hypothetical protein
MNPLSSATQAQSPTEPELPGCRVTELSIPELVGEVFEAAPPQARGPLLEPLLRPLGLLSIFGVAGGIFARVKLGNGWQVEDFQSVRAADVAALVDHAQQVSVEVLDGLVQMLAVTPGLSSSAAAVLLVAVLVGRARGPGAAAR